MSEEEEEEEDAKEDIEHLIAEIQDERERQGLTLVHFSAQPEPFLTQDTPYTPRNTPDTP